MRRDGSDHGRTLCIIFLPLPICLYHSLTLHHIRCLISLLSTSFSLVTVIHIVAFIEAEFKAKRICKGEASALTLFLLWLRSRILLNVWAMRRTRKGEVEEENTKTNKQRMSAAVWQLWHTARSQIARKVTSKFRQCFNFLFGAQLTKLL